MTELPFRLQKIEDYDPESVYECLKGMIDSLGGIGSFIKRGERVLIKPNLLSAHDPSRHITTHPSVVEAMARILKERGAVVAIGDSPALDQFQKVISKTGMLRVSEKIGVPLVEFTDPRPIKEAGNRIFKRIEVAAQVLDSDKIISIAKLKTHSQMLMTLGVKNNFGTVVKQAKAEWHSTAGTSRDLFAGLLLDIYLAINPVLTIIDGIWGMEGLGPTNGRPIKIGVLGVGTDAVLLDLGILSLLEIPWDSFPVYRQARVRGLVGEGILPRHLETRLEGIPKLKGFQVPRLDSMRVIPRGLEALTRKYLISRPIVIDSICEKCERCVRICPQKAMKRHNNKIRIDYDLCIRCFCCQEVCDKNAITFKKGAFLKITERLF